MKADGGGIQIRRQQKNESIFQYIPFYAQDIFMQLCSLAYKSIGKFWCCIKILECWLCNVCTRVLPCCSMLIAHVLRKVVLLNLQSLQRIKQARYLGLENVKQNSAEKRDGIIRGKLAGIFLRAAALQKHNKPKMRNKYSQKRNYCTWPQLSPNFYIHVSLSDLYVYSRSVCLFCILGIYKSLTDKRLWKLGMRPRNSFSGIFVAVWIIAKKWVQINSSQVTIANVLMGYSL